LVIVYVKFSDRSDDHTFSLSTLYFDLNPFTILRVFFQTEAIMRGFPSDLNAQQVLAQLVKASQPVTNNSVRPTQTYADDLVTAVDILVKMAKCNGKQVNLPQQKILKIMRKWPVICWNQQTTELGRN